MASFSIPDCRLRLAAAAANDEARWAAGEAIDTGGVGGSNGDGPKLCRLAAACIDARCDAATDAADERREDGRRSSTDDRSIASVVAIWPFGCCSWMVIDDRCGSSLFTDDRDGLRSIFGYGTIYPCSSTTRCIPSETLQSRHYVIVSMTRTLYIGLVSLSVAEIKWTLLYYLR